MKKVLSIIIVLVVFSINLCAEELYVTESGIYTLSDGTVLTITITKNAEDVNFNISWVEVYEDFSFYCGTSSEESTFTTSTNYISADSDNQNTTVIIYDGEPEEELFVAVTR